MPNVRHRLPRRSRGAARRRTITAILAPPRASTGPLAAAVTSALLALVLAGSTNATAADDGLVGEMTSSEVPPATVVEPVGDWLEFREILWRKERIGLNLRAGFARPMVLPEPVTLVGAPELPGCAVTVDSDVVLFEPSRIFDAQPIDLVGANTGRIYRFRIRASTEGKRVPVQIVVPDGS